MPGRGTNSNSVAAKSGTRLQEHAGQHHIHSRGRRDQRERDLESDNTTTHTHTHTHTHPHTHTQMERKKERGRTNHASPTQGLSQTPPPLYQTRTFYSHSTTNRCSADALWTCYTPTLDHTAHRNRGTVTAAMMIFVKGDACLFE